MHNKKHKRRKLPEIKKNPFVFPFLCWQFVQFVIYFSSCAKWPVGQAVKTLASHAGNMGSIPVRVTTNEKNEPVLHEPVRFFRLRWPVPQSTRKRRLRSNQASGFALRPAGGFVTAFTSCQVGGGHIHQPAKGTVNAFVGQMQKL